MTKITRKKGTQRGGAISWSTLEAHFTMGKTAFKKCNY